MGLNCFKKKLKNWSQNQKWGPQVVCTTLKLLRLNWKTNVCITDLAYQGQILTTSKYDVDDQIDEDDQDQDDEEDQDNYTDQGMYQQYEMEENDEHYDGVHSSLTNLTKADLSVNTSSQNFHFRKQLVNDQNTNIQSVQYPTSKPSVQNPMSMYPIFDPPQPKLKTNQKLHKKHMPKLIWHQLAQIYSTMFKLYPRTKITKLNQCQVHQLYPH